MDKKTLLQKRNPLLYTGKFNCCTFKVAAEQKARATYEKLIDLCKDDPDVIEPLRFLRQREVVHFQRFGEALRGVQDKLAQKNFCMNNCKNNMELNCTKEFNSINNYNTNDSLCNR